MILVGGVIGATAVWTIREYRDHSNKAKVYNDNSNRAKREHLQGEGETTRLSSEIHRLNSELAKVRGERDAAELSLQEAKFAKVESIYEPSAIIKALPELYHSNEGIFHRRRIHLLETLVDIGPDSLDSIEMFLKENRDAEPDIALDRNHRIADQYGMETTEVEQLMVFVGEIRPELEKQREEFKEKLGEIKRDPKNRNMSRNEYEDLRREIRVNDELSDDILNKLKELLPSDQYAQLQEQEGGTRRFLEDLAGVRDPIKTLIKKDFDRKIDRGKKRK